MDQRTQIAVPITSAQVPLPEQVRAAAAAGADLVELRVDLIGDVAPVEDLLRRPRVLPAILTVRAADEGGAFNGSDAERIALIERLGLLQPGYVDVEYATWSRSANLRQKIGLVCETGSDNDAHASDTRRPRNQLILSYHDFKGIPADLDTILDRLGDTPAAVAKVAFAPRDATDTCRLLTQLQRRSRRPWIALAMGEAGLPSRLLAGKFGAFLTFATISQSDESAPGQPRLSDLRRIHRWDAVASTTKVYGVVGWPVGHSQSPRVHNAAMDAAGIDGVYVPWAVGPDYEPFCRFMNTVVNQDELDVMGLSVTLPHKQHAARWLASMGLPISPVARRCGAVNTLVRRRDGWQGENTDAHGALAALRGSAEQTESDLRGRHVAVLGAGGAARAIVAGLLTEGCQVTVYNRSHTRSEQLAHELGCHHAPWERRSEYAGDVLINCTSVGLHPAVNDSPVPAHAIRPNTLVFDTVYNPPRTRLLREAQDRGCETVSGVEMFLAQAAAQFQYWHGAAPDVDRMRAALA